MSAATPLWASVSDLDPSLVTDHASATEALEYASYVMWALSGRMYQPVVTVTEEYETSVALAARSEVYPVFMHGYPYNVSLCSECRCRGCGTFHRTRLRGYPVSDIVEVVIGGEVIPPEQYVLLDYSVLGFKTPLACGAPCIVVEYTYGSGISSGAKNAVVKLAEQLLLASTGAPCSLPARVTSISRQGMNYTLLDPQDFLDKGRTGIYEIDLVLNAMNPARVLKRPRVFSPDIPRGEVRTTFRPATPVPPPPVANPVPLKSKYTK